MTQTKNNRQTEMFYWLKIVLVLAIQILFRFLPNFGQVTDLGMSILGIFLGAIVGWCICDAAWPSITAILLLGMTDYGTISGIFSTLFSNTALLIVMLSFIFAGVILSCGLSDWLGKWLISRKVLRGKPWLLTFCIILTMYIGTAMCGSGTAIMILLWEVIYSIANQAGIRKETNRWPTIMVFSLLYVIAIGQIVSWGTAPVAVIGLAQSIDMEIVLQPWPFLLYGMIVSSLLLGTSIIVNFLIFRPDITPLKNTYVEEPPKITKQQKAILYIVAIFMVLMLIPSMLPAKWAFVQWMRQFGTIGTLLIAIGAALIVRIDGKPVAVFNAAAAKGVIWNPLFMMGTALTIAGALTSAETGVTETLSAWLLPLFSGMAPFWFAAMIILLTIIFTNLLNNIVVASLFLTIVYSLKDVIGIDPYPLVIVMIYSCYPAVLLPSSNPMTAFMFGNKDKIKNTDIFRYALVSIVTGSLVLIFIGYPLACVFYG